MFACLKDIAKLICYVFCDVECFYQNCWTSSRTNETFFECIAILPKSYSSKPASTKENLDIFKKANLCDILSYFAIILDSFLSFLLWKFCIVWVFGAKVPHCRTIFWNTTFICWRSVRLGVWMWVEVKWTYPIFWINVLRNKKFSNSLFGLRHFIHLVSWSMTGWVKSTCSIHRCRIFMALQQGTIFV